MSTFPTDVLLVTGGAGFIGSNFVIDWVTAGRGAVVNIDKLTYAGNINNLDALSGLREHVLVKADINDREKLRSLFAHYHPRAVVHFAAESHVDRSIHYPAVFVETNVLGTQTLLDEARNYWNQLSERGRNDFRFLHISTDEVYGSLKYADPPFTETSPYRPSSPYAASKAAADHLVRACYCTHGLPAIITNCSNNFEPYQFPEKLIPLMIINAIREQPLPVYGDGMHVRDWLDVSDHCAALRVVLERGKPGETYNIGSSNERTNLEVVRTLCELLDEMRPRGSGKPHYELVQFVTERPGHDRRYALATDKLTDRLGWKATGKFESSLRRTVQWYLDNQSWVERVIGGNYQDWVTLNYRHRAKQ